MDRNCLSLGRLNVQRWPDNVLRSRDHTYTLEKLGHSSVLATNNYIVAVNNHHVRLSEITKKQHEPCQKQKCSGEEQGGGYSHLDVERR